MFKTTFCIYFLLYYIVVSVVTIEENQGQVLGKLISKSTTGPLSTLSKDQSKKDEDYSKDSTKGLLETQLKGLLKSLILQTRDKIESNNPTATENNNLMKLTSTNSVRTSIEDKISNDSSKNDNIIKNSLPITNENNDEELDLASTSISKLVDDTIEKRVKEAQKELSTILMKSLEKRIKHASDLLQDKKLNAINTANQGNIDSSLTNQGVNSSECIDEILGCTTLRNQNMCFLEKKLMERDCKLTCGFCTPQGNPKLTNLINDIPYGNIKDSTTKEKVEDNKTNSDEKLKVLNKVESNQDKSSETPISDENKETHPVLKSKKQRKPLTLSKSTTKHFLSSKKQRKSKSGKIKKASLKSKINEKKKKLLKKSSKSSKKNLKTKKNTKSSSIKKNSHYNPSSLVPTAKRQSHSPSCPAQCANKRICPTKCPKHCCKSEHKKKSTHSKEKTSKKTRCPANCPAKCKPQCTESCCSRSEKEPAKKIDVSDISMVKSNKLENSYQTDKQFDNNALNYQNSNLYPGIQNWYGSSNDVPGEIYSKNSIMAENPVNTCGDFCSASCYPSCDKICCQESKPNNRDAIGLFSENILSSVRNTFDPISSSQSALTNPSSFPSPLSMIPSFSNDDFTNDNGKLLSQPNFNNVYDMKYSKSNDDGKLGSFNGLNQFDSTNESRMTSNARSSLLPFSDNNANGLSLDKLNSISIRDDDGCPIDCKSQCTDNCPRTCCSKSSYLESIGPLNKVKKTNLVGTEDVNNPSSDFAEDDDRSNQTNTPIHTLVNEDNYDQLCNNSCKYRCDDQCVLKGCCDK